MKSYKFYKCSLCNETWYHLCSKLKNNIFTCQECSKNKQDKKLKFSPSNEMNPNIPPQIFKELSHVEELLIIRAIPVMRIYKVKGNGSYSS